MKNVSILDFYEKEIKELVDTGASLRSIWKIICSKMPTDNKVSYPTFWRYYKKKESIWMDSSL
ncbi:MAG: hypothetical protein PHH92_10745 [Aliarcobacter skirrowii]|jgi:hypothetical protein|uniref:hypothetical protein n=1 Tax=Aliarcobacter skirrowii TaxID=28200 RepID=UPI0024332D44|nr:hypothetical protein [Aliarcobacter skirrowii]MDD2975071.1 hypothetical protein [Aliarcobacter cryaerophilus]MDD3497849.1 hypothetical protein [Aliarcobacter skirrowii]